MPTSVAGHDTSARTTLEYSGVLWEFGDAIVAMILSMGISNNEIGFRAKEEETV